MQLGATAINAIGLGSGSIRRTALGQNIAQGSDPYFSPKDIDTALWLDAADASTITSSLGAVSQWNDKSGKGNHLVQATGANQPTITGNSIVCSSNDSLSITPPTGTLNAQGTTSLFIVHDLIDATTASSNFTTIFRNASTATDPTKRRPFVIYGKVADAINFSNSSSGAPLLSSTSTKTGKTVLSYTQSGTQATLYAQGVLAQQISSTPNTSVTAESLIIGNLVDTMNNMAFNEVILINGLVTDADRQKIEGYLAWKWNLAANLPASHPYKNYRPRSNYWTPAEITTAAWYDAQDFSTITQSGNLVSQWNDKSGNGRHATQGTGSKQPTVESINSAPAIRFDGTDDSLIVPKPAAFGSMSIFCVWDLQTANSNYVYATNSSVNSTRVYMSRASAITGRFDGGQSDAIPFLAFNNNLRITVHESTQLTSPHDSYLYRDGTSQGSLLGSVLPADDITDFRLGSRSVGGTDSVFSNSTIGEFIVIDNGGVQVPTNVRQRIEGYLAHRWGLTAELPSDHPYKTVRP